LIADKVVFGIAAAVFVVMGIRSLASNPTLLLGLAIIKALMWTTAALTSFVVLVRPLSVQHGAQ
jgi:hypothetical protein